MSDATNDKEREAMIDGFSTAGGPGEAEAGEAEKVQKAVADVEAAARWMNANDLPLLTPDVAMSFAQMAEIMLQAVAVVNSSPCSETTRGIVRKYVAALRNVAAVNLKRLEALRQGPGIVIAQRLPINGRQG